MRINLFYKGVLLAATLCVAPAVLPASPRASQPGARVTESSGGAMPINASSLLQQVQIDALRVRNDADQLQADLRFPSESDWKADADLMSLVRGRVNEMDKLLFQLRENQAEASPLQQKEIERITPSVLNLTDTAQDAIATLNNNREEIYFPNMAGLTRDVYDRASQIARTTGDFEQYANARHEVRQLKQTLGLKNNI
jgi:hypothetical protein